VEQRLKEQWERIDALKAALIARVAALPEVSQRKSSAADEWSPLQILSHLVQAEAVVAGYARAGVPTNPPSLSQRAAVRLLCTALRSGIRLPTPETMEPEAEPRPLDQLTAEWSAGRERMKNAQAEMAPNDLFGTHPLFGPITVSQTLEMMETHLIYHQKRFPKIT